MPVRTYENWNNRPSDQQEQIEPFRKYIFICEGANTESFYFKRLIDLRKQLGIHPLVDIRLWEKTDEDRNLSFPKNLQRFANKQKDIPQNGFDKERDKLIIVFDGEFFEEKVQGYNELINSIEKDDIAAVTNPGFEVFLLLHIDGSYENYIMNNELQYLCKDEDGSYSYAQRVLRRITGINAKHNSEIGKLADNVLVAIAQEKQINQNIHEIKGKVSSNIGAVIETIMNDEPAFIE